MRRALFVVGTCFLGAITGAVVGYLNHIPGFGAVLGTFGGVYIAALVADDIKG